MDTPGREGSGSLASTAEPVSSRTGAYTQAGPQKSFHKTDFNQKPLG